MIEVLEPGARTTIQDLGRFGYRALGIGPAGAFDELAARAANAAVGNPPEAAVLEFTMTAPVLRFDDDVIVAVCGASVDLDAGIPIVVQAGEVLRLGAIRLGVRGYLAVRGGIGVEPVLGSRSTHVASGIGPPVLCTGMRLPVGHVAPYPPAPVEPPVSSAAVRVVGAAEAFSARVDPSSDRTGVRLMLDDPMDGAGTDPEPMLPGMIQVPPAGHPIVLGPDAPTTGGYRVIGTVARIDRGVIAQARPGQMLRFEPADEEPMRRAWNDAVACFDRSI